MTYKVLIIEDEECIRKIISDYFEAQKFKVIQACDGVEGLEKFQNETIDIIILDIMMPKLDGWSVCKEIRKKSDIPIIILTAKTEKEDELMGFELKGDDYVKKPFDPEVLVARAQILLKRTKGCILQDKSKIFNHGLEINKLSRNVNLDNKSIDLTPKEFDLFLYLIENEGIVLSREKILSKIWGYDFEGDNRVVDNHIKKIRKSIKDRAYLIKTVFGVGYKFEVK